MDAISPSVPDLATHQQNYRDLGFTVVDKALAELPAEKLRAAFLGAEFDIIDQTRKSHFAHVFKTDDPHLPRAHEVYRAKFERSEDLERDVELNALFEAHIKPVLEEVVGKKLGAFDLRCLRMSKGGFMRTHIDDYAGEVGFILYLCKDWKWDWGGLFHAVVDGDVHVAMPRFNQLSVVNHGGVRPPHFVSTVAEYALEDRLMLVGFSRD